METAERPLRWLVMAFPVDVEDLATYNGLNHPARDSPEPRDSHREDLSLWFS